MNINGYTLVNEEKINRAIYGTVGRLGQLTGGVGEKATPEQIIAEYDRLGGLILKGEYKVKTGAFYDFEKRQARPEKDVILVLTDIAGNFVEIKEDGEIPLEVKAVKVAKAAKAKKLKKKDNDDEE